MVRTIIEKHQILTKSKASVILSTKKNNSSDEEVAESLIETFVPRRQKEEVDPIIEETTEVIYQQGLSPRGSKYKKKKEKGGQARLPHIHQN